MRKTRITWHEYALRIAEVAAQRSEDIKQVGACALDINNRVIGVAYNGLAPGKDVHDSFWDDRDKRLPFMLHAEVNLLSLFKRGECNLLACTISPCASCAAMIAAYGIKQVYYRNIYKRDKTGLDILDFYGIEHFLIK